MKQQATSPTKAITPDEAAQFDEIRQAMETSSISMMHLVKVHYGRFSMFNKVEASRTEYQKLYPSVLKAYEERAGPIRRSYFSNSIQAFVLLAEIDGLKVGCELKPSDIIAFTNRAQRIAGDIYDYMTDGRIGALNILFAAISQAIGNLEERAERDNLRPRAADTQLLETLTGELDRAQRQIKKAARLLYLFGVLVGLGAALLLSGLLLLLVPLLPIDSSFAPIISVSSLFGAIGASMGVILRLHTGRLEVDQDAGKRTLRLTGIFRPLIGAFAGLLTYLMHVSGLLLGSISANIAPNPIFFYAVISFFGGLTERIFHAGIGTVLEADTNSGRS